MARPPAVRRQPSTFLPANLGDELRDLQASLIKIAPPGDPLEGLAVLRLHRQQSRDTFFIPHEVASLPLEPRRGALSMLLEDRYTQEGVDVILGIERRPLKQRLDDRLRDLIRVRVRLG